MLRTARTFPKFRPNFSTQFYTRNASYRRFNNTSPQISLANIFRSRWTLYVSGGALAFYLYNLDEAPVTHRYRFLWVPYWLEKKIGDYSYSQILYQYKNQIAPPSDPAYRQILKIMNNLLSSAIQSLPDPRQKEHIKNLKWQIHIIRSDASADPPNAFILPNGKIFIFSSIFPICKNEDGLATVLAHELSHQLAHHSLEQLSKQPIYIMLSTLLYAATGISGFNDLLIAGFLQMPASREMESEADRIGCELMARSCYNVREASAFWRRMEQWENDMKLRSMLSSGGVLQEFLSTHPNTHKRQQDIELWMPELEQIKEQAGCYQWGAFQQTLNFFK